MEIVLHSEVNLEPITVVDLDARYVEQLKRQGRINVAVMEPVRITNPALVDYTPPPVVTIYALYVDRGPRLGASTLYVVPERDEVLALTINPAWLPGQRIAVNSMEKANREMLNFITKRIRKNY